MFTHLIPLTKKSGNEADQVNFNTLMTQFHIETLRVLLDIRDLLTKPK